jgi:polar amino acid transport system substrate-binding protein
MKIGYCFSVKSNQGTSLTKINSLTFVLVLLFKKLKSNTLLVMLFGYLSFTQIGQTAEINQNENLIINYFADGQEHFIYGKKTSKGYRFNANAKKIINLATLNWPPYISQNICNKGWVFQFAVALLASKDYQVNIHFYPWARSVKLVEQGTMDVLFPEYFIEENAPSDNYPRLNRRELLSLSSPFPGGSLALLQRKGGHFNLDAGLSALKGKVIGVVRGYQNTPEFDAMMDAKLFSVVEAVDELQLIKLLVARRVELIVGDPKVFNFTVNFSSLDASKKQQILDDIEQVEPALDYNPLYFAVSKKSLQAAQIMEDLNMAILQFESDGETDRLIQLGDQCTHMPLLQSQ